VKRVERIDEALGKLDERAFTPEAAFIAFPITRV